MTPKLPGNAAPSKPKRPERPVRTYDAAGEFRGLRSPESAKALIESKLAVPVMNRKGFTVALHLIGDAADGKSPILRDAHVGTRYSHVQALNGGGRVWDLKRLGGKRDGINYAPKESRAAFFSVLDSCTVERGRGEG